MEKYKILHIITRFMKSGGAERNTYFTVKGLNKEKYEVDLIIGGESEVFPKEPEINLIKINSLKRNINLESDLLAFFSLYNLIKRRKYHLVHTHQSKAGILGRLAAKLAGAEVIVHTIHGPLFHPTMNPVFYRFLVFMEKISAIWTDRFIVVGEELKKYYLKQGIGKAEKYSVIRSGMDIEKFCRAREISLDERLEIKKSLGVSSENPIVGQVGALEKRKGYQYAILAAKEVLKKHPEVKFLFVGSGPLKMVLKKKAEEAGIKNSVIFSGFREDIEKVISVFDIFIFTSLGRGEGVPQALVQGALLGKPMVCFDSVLGAKEVIKENGFIVPFKDVKALADKINYLLSDLEKAKKIGKKGMALINDDWRVERMVEKISLIYNDLLSKKIH